MIVHERSDQSRRLTDPIEAWDRRRPSRPPLIPRARQRRYLPTDLHTSDTPQTKADVWKSVGK